MGRRNTALFYDGMPPPKTMDISRRQVLGFTLVFGPLVLISYAYGLSHVGDPNSLWGGVPLSWQTYIVPFMFIAAFGFLLYWYTAFYHLDETTLSSMRWPGGTSDGKGAKRLLLSYALFLIPSALWIESTIFHIENHYPWTFLLVIGTLFLTSMGNVMLGLLAYGSYRDGVKGSGKMIIGAILLAIQCILNDFIIWVYKFPW